MSCRKACKKKTPIHQQKLIVIIIITITIFRNQFYGCIFEIREFKMSRRRRRRVRQKSNRFEAKTTTLHVQLTVWSYDFFAVTARLISRFIDKGEQTTTNCSVLDIFLKDSPPGEFNINNSRFRFVILA